MKVAWKYLLVHCIGLVMVLGVVGFGNRACAQILHPVKWSYGSKMISVGNGRVGAVHGVTDRGGVVKEAWVFLKATIDPGWHIYSAYQPDGGPVKTSFEFDKSAAYALSGQVFEPKPESRMESAFNMRVNYFENTVVFRQRVRLLKSGPVVVKGKLRFMVCNDRQCLPPEDVAFEVNIK